MLFVAQLTHQSSSSPHIFLSFASGSAWLLSALTDTRHRPVIQAPTELRSVTVFVVMLRHSRPSSKENPSTLCSAGCRLKPALLIPMDPMVLLLLLRLQLLQLLLLGFYQCVNCPLANHKSPALARTPGICWKSGRIGGTAGGASSVNGNGTQG